MATLHIKPKPYDFTKERERLINHEARLATAKHHAGGRSVCPYCYQVAMGTVRSWRCGCPL